VISTFTGPAKGFRNRVSAAAMTAALKARTGAEDGKYIRPPRVARWRG
jgi:hypothetical protein